MVETTVPGFEFDLSGRVRNLSLPASSTNSLIPIFEAINNSIHAVEARFGKDAPSKGKITVEILRRVDGDRHPIGFVIEDNGIGLTDLNTKSFCTSDSLFKVEKGGIHHVLLQKNLRFQDNGTHWIFFGAHDRVVSKTAIDGQVGLKYVGDNKDCVYVGLLSFI